MDLGRATRTARLPSTFLARRIADGIRRAHRTSSSRRRSAGAVRPGAGPGLQPPLEDEAGHWRPPNPFGGEDRQVAHEPGIGDATARAGRPDGPGSVRSLRCRRRRRPADRAAGQLLAALRRRGCRPATSPPTTSRVFADRMQELLGADRLDPPFVGIMSNGTSGDVNNIDFREPLRPRPSERGCARWPTASPGSVKVVRRHRASATGCRCRRARGIETWRAPAR